MVLGDNKMAKIICITDYKNHFGSKWQDSPYRSGFDKQYLSKLFDKYDYSLEFITASSVDFIKANWTDQVVLYTSSEEYGYYYKNFLEDITYGLKEAGAILLPDPAYLKANNNKIFMEILRNTKLPLEMQTISAQLFGTYDELDHAIQRGKIDFPCVLKKSAGAMSRGVFLAKNEHELRREARKLSRTGLLRVALKEWGRARKHQGYKPQSGFQGKFILQPFIPGLKNDWKVLVFGEKYFVLKRNIRENDFRASGSHYKYTSGSQADFPVEMLNLVRDFYLKLDVPSLSVDFAYDGKQGYIFEFQAIYFGTSTVFKSNDYYEYIDGVWKLKKKDMDIEQLYVHSIVEYLKRQPS
jgi:glutathione synthase/RimK-type ligase-like ATP-grasp enzyme